MSIFVQSQEHVRAMSFPKRPFRIEPGLQELGLIALRCDQRGRGAAQESHVVRGAAHEGEALRIPIAQRLGEAGSSEPEVINMDEMVRFLLVAL